MIAHANIENTVTKETTVMTTTTQGADQMTTTTHHKETTMTTTKQLLDETLAAYYHERRVWQSASHLPWNRDQAKRLGILSTKCERLRRQLDAEKAAA